MKKSFVKLVATSAVALTLVGAAVPAFAKDQATVDAAKAAFELKNQEYAKAQEELAGILIPDPKKPEDPGYSEYLEYKQAREAKVAEVTKLENEATELKAAYDKAVADKAAADKAAAEKKAKEEEAKKKAEYEKNEKEIKEVEAKAASAELEEITQTKYETKEEAVKAAKEFFAMYKNDTPVLSFKLEQRDGFYLSALLDETGEIKPDGETTPEQKPEESSKEESSKEESSKEESSKEADKPAAKPAKKDEKKAELPQTGEASTFAIVGAAVLSALAGLGFVAKKEN